MIYFSLLIFDKIYGNLEINEPVIVDLINSAPVQRLKKINQYGSNQYIWPWANTTRFEHSVGVWWLSRKFNRPLEEQIACLIHDVGHTAFSHVVDYALGDSHKQGLNDEVFEKIIKNSEIPKILEKHKLDLEFVTNLHNFPLLEKDLPDISFDRLDYFLRDTFTNKLAPKEILLNFISELKIEDKNLFFSKEEQASFFAILFLNISKLFWAHPTSHGSYFLLANVIKIALEEKIITMEDLWRTDEVVFDKLLNCKINKITNIMERLKPGKEFVYAEKNKAEFFGKNKPRFVDPWVLKNGTLKKLSEINLLFKEYFSEYSKSVSNYGVKPSYLI